MSLVKKTIDIINKYVNTILQICSKINICSNFLKDAYSNFSKSIICDDIIFDDDYKKLSNIILETQICTLINSMCLILLHTLKQNKSQANETETYINTIRSITQNQFMNETLYIDKQKNSICEDCNIIMQLNYLQGIEICTQCGYKNDIGHIDINDKSMNNFLSISNNINISKSKLDIKIYNNKNYKLVQQSSLNTIIKHNNSWLYQIFGIEIKEIPEEIKTKIKMYMKEDNLPDISLNCKIIRNYLKRMGKTIYNPHVTKIKKIITGIYPKPPTNEELEDMQNKIDLLNRIQAEELSYASSNIKKNKAHYFPHLLRIVIINVYYGDNKRIQSILECIHMQDKKTREINDEKIKKLCAKTNGEIKYIKWP